MLRLKISSVFATIIPYLKLAITRKLHIMMYIIMCELFELGHSGGNMTGADINLLHLRLADINDGRLASACMGCL